MDGLAYAVAALMFVGLNVYVLSGGADFGGGVWDLLASGPRRERQRELITHAIGPIWEANHVWLIFVVVLLFMAFPPAFAALSIALHIPIALALLGIVFRGTSFVFRTYDPADGKPKRHWRLTFAIASTVTPVMLGVVVGAIVSGGVTLDPLTGRVQTDFFSAWLAPFPFAVGGYALALFAFLSAVYLTLETDEPALREDFRRRALAAGVAVGAMAWLCLLLTPWAAPGLFRALLGHPWAIPFHVVTGVVALAALWAVWRRRYPAARVLAIGQASLILWGWAVAQFPYVLPPHLTIADAAAESTIQLTVLIVVAGGGVILAPSLWYLFWVFKGRRARAH